MSIYTISDLHLSFGSNKPMNIFRGWENHTERLFANWNRLVNQEDTVVLPGDFSWGLKLEDTLEDFKFLNKLNGKKILLKGNHDLWWSTVKKLNEFLTENEINAVTGATITSKTITTGANCALKIAASLNEKEAEK